METNNDLKEALAIIEDLVKTIGWLGGDAYEMEAIEPSLNSANEFLDKFKPVEVPVISTKNGGFNYGSSNPNFGVYCLIADESRTVIACNKRVAAKYLSVGKNAVKCLREPYSR